MCEFNVGRSQLPTISCLNTTEYQDGDRQQPVSTAYTGTATKRGDETILWILVLENQDNPMERNPVCTCLPGNPVVSFHDHSAEPDTSWT